MKSRQLWILIIVIVLCFITAISIPFWFIGKDIHEATKEGDLAKISSILRSKPNLVSDRNEFGQTPLHAASALGHKDIVEFLLSSGANINVRDKAGFTPLHWAVFENKEEVAEFLIIRGALVDANDIRDMTPLHWAARQGSLAITKLLISNGSDVNSKAQSNEEQTPLHFAAISGRPEVVEVLISKGAVVNARDEYGRTPLHEAANNKRHNGTIQILLSNGADLTAKDRWGETPLEEAMPILRIGSTADWKSARTLFEHSIYIEPEDRYDSTKTVTFLLANGADANTTNHSTGQPIFLDATLGGLKEIVEAFLSCGVNVNTKGKDDITALHLASGMGYKPIVELLLANGANVNAETKQRATPLWLARNYSHHEIAELLLKHGGVTDDANQEQKVNNRKDG